MRKEALFAIFFGVVLGLIITYGIYQARSSLFRPKETNSEVLVPLPTPLPGDTGKLVLHSPEDGIVITESKITVAGTTVANSYVIILIGNTEKITNSDDSGNFSVEVELEKDSNSISVYTLEEDGSVVSVERTVIVSEQSFEKSASEPASASATATPTVTPKSTGKVTPTKPAPTKVVPTKATP